jgi:protein regulator of cytokinesis 1
LEELRSKKQERIKQFSEIQSQVVQICAEIAGSGQSNSSDSQVNECDLTVRQLEELKSHLQELQTEKVPLQ